MHNIFIDALRIGEEKINDGITYKELKQRLIVLGYELEDTYEKTFRMWFFQSFHTWDIAKQFPDMINERTLKNWIETGRFIDTKQFLRPEAHYNYIEYIELEDAKQTARQAQRTAIIAIAITGVLALIQIFIEII